MSDTSAVNDGAETATTVSEEATAKETDAPDSPSSDGKFDAEYVKSLRNEAAKYRTQAKELAEKAKAYDEYTESQKSEAQKLADALKATADERDAARNDLLRLQVASKKNLPTPLADRLRGGTLEEMEADADALLAGLKGQFVEKQKPSSEQTGAGITGETGDTTAEDFLQLLRARG